MKTTSVSSQNDHFFILVLDEWGVEIQNIRIESLKINDPILQKNISNNAIDVSKQVLCHMICFVRLNNTLAIACLAQ